MKHKALRHAVPCFREPMPSRERCLNWLRRLLCLRFCLVLAIVLNFGCEGSDSLEQATQLRVSVTRVVDGDTLLVSDSGVTREVHLSNLECPELTQPSGVAAAIWMAERCEGREVVVAEFRRDTAGLYGVVMVDGVNLNLDLARAGYAHLSDPSSADPAVVDAVGEAQLQFRGLWKAFATPIEPAEWRKMTAGLQPGSDRPLEGIWEVTSAKWNGKENPGSLGAYYIFCGGKQTTCESPFNIESQFVLDPSKHPARIDYKREMSNGIVEISGIYQLEGDRVADHSDAEREETLRLSKAVYPDLDGDWAGRDFEWSAPEWCVRVRDSAGSLASHVGVHFRDASVDGEPVRIGGVGNVKTHPESRRRGFARAGVRRAVEFFYERANIDVALLVCEPSLIEYYARLGWCEFTGRSLVRQYGEIVEFTFNRAMTIGIQVPNPVDGEIDWCGPPW